MTTTIPMRFVVAPSGFKESLDAESVAAAMAAGVRRAIPGAQVDTVPLVDGGEGSARTLATATGGELVPVRVTGPVGEPVDAHFAVLGGQGPRTGFVEMAAAAGLRLVPPGHRNPGLTTTYGVGQLVTAALDADCSRILVGCGDSGTSDGGAGALRALGARVVGPDGQQVADGGYALADAVDLDVSDLDPRLAETELLVACNPHNVLTGEHGVARVFGPQKGATEEQVCALDKALTQWAKLIEYRCDRDLRLAAGGGASGGLGAGLAGVLGARLLPRFDVLLDHVDLDAKVARADLVLTAEGAIDFQTPNGKVPAEVARRAKLANKPVIALAGTIGAGARATHEAGIDAYTGIVAAPSSLSEAFDRAAELVTDATERTLRLVLVGSSLCA